MSRLFPLFVAVLAAACSSAPPEPRGPAAPQAESGPEPPREHGEEPRDDTSPPLALELGRSRSGVTVLVLPPADGPLEPHAEICLSLPAGRRHGRPGLAVLAVEALVAVAEGASGRPPLRRAISDLGGALETQTGIDQSWVYLRVPAAHWETALDALVGALSEPATARQRLDRLRSEVLLRHAERLLGDQSHLTVAEGLLFGDGGPARRLEALQDRDPAEILLFQRRYFRPEGSILALRLTGGRPETVVQGATEKLDAWAAAAMQPDLPRQTRLTGAIHWIPGEGGCRAVLVLALPDPLAPDAPDQWVLQECLTMGGVGGRFERTLIESGGAPLFESRTLHTGTQGWLALTARIDPEQVGRLWRVMREARSSLAAVGPSESERAVGERRARLGLLAARSSSFGQMQIAIRVTSEGLVEDPLQTQLERLADPGRDLAAGESAWLALPVAMIVLGGQPVAGEDVVVHAAATDKAVERLAGGNVRAQIEDARPYLDKVLQAMGGPHKVGAVTGYRVAAEFRGPEGPIATEEIELEGGDLRRTRSVLGSTVRTVVDGGRGREFVGDDSVDLEPAAVADLIREANRNPLMLLSAHARGRLHFRLVSVRRVDDRDVVVLEAVRSPYARLRLHVDLRSGLPRVIESWREDDVGPIYLRERYSDFRNIDGVRVPFHRVRDMDDGSGRSESVVTRFELLF